MLLRLKASSPLEATFLPTKVGDKVRQANGTTGTVRIVKTEQKNQTMYNLDIAKLDNFYVGEQGWLVHNQNFSSCPVAGAIIEELLKNRSRVQHASEHLIEAGIITANAGTKDAFSQFGTIAQDVLGSPTKIFTHTMLEGLPVTSYYKMVDGNPIVIHIANSNHGNKIKYGDIVTAIVPKPSQLANWGLK